MLGHLYLAFEPIIEFLYYPQHLIEKMKNYLSFAFMICSLLTFGQSFPSPDAYQMIKNIAIPVNLYNGTASVNVPLHVVEANNGAKVPISLQYNTSGIKVQEVAGVAGLGWNLIAGGQLSRVMRGQPDELRTYASELNYANVKAAAEWSIHEWQRENSKVSLIDGLNCHIKFTNQVKTYHI